LATVSTLIILGAIVKHWTGFNCMSELVRLFWGHSRRGTLLNNRGKWYVKLIVKLPINQCCSLLVWHRLPWWQQIRRISSVKCGFFMLKRFEAQWRKFFGLNFILSQLLSAQNLIHFKGMDNIVNMEVFFINKQMTWNFRNRRVTNILAVSDPCARFHVIEGILQLARSKHLAGVA
jgi:hypothetical protein